MRLQVESGRSKKKWGTNGADLDAKAQEALSQIDEKNYADRFDSTGKEVVKIALVFSDDLKGLGKMAYGW